MTKKKKRNHSFLFYLLIVLNVLASALALYGLSQRWQVRKESRSAYEEIQKAAAVRSETLLIATAPPEETYFSQGMEEEEANQEATMWLMHRNRPEDSAFGLALPPVEETGAAEEAEGLERPEGSEAGEGLERPEGSEAAEEIERPEGSGAAEEAEAKKIERPEGSEGSEGPTLAPWLERTVQENSARYTVDFDYLQSIYPGTVAWLMQESTGLSYPVMQGSDNAYYLDRLYNGSKNKDGSIFLDCGNSAEFMDANNYLYGHNVKTGDMFGMLPKYKSQQYYDANPYFTLMTPYSDFRIDLFAGTMSLVEDEASWRIKQFKRKADFDAYILELKENSFFKSDVIPQWGDQFLVLCTCTNIAHGQRYVIYGRMRPIRYGTEESIAIAKMEMDERESISGPYAVGTLGTLQLYAQNDPLWQSLRYETRASSKKRSFGDGGNGPVAVSMAVANLVPMEELPRIMGYAQESAGFTFCTHSVNQYFCNKLHAQYQIQTPQEYLRYLPMAMAGFTTGNNLWENVSREAGKGGTSMDFLPYIAGIYDLTLRPTIVLGQVMDALGEGAMAVCLTGGEKSPFTGGSQYVVLAGMDEEFVYLLDPFFRENYNRTDRKKLLEIITPGAVRVKRENVEAIGLSAFYILQGK